MGKTSRYECEGTVVEIPLRWNERSKKEIEDYSSFIEQSPIYTPEGRPILLAIEDACPYAELADDDPLGVECAACACFRRSPGSLLGVCHNEKMRSGPAMRTSTGASEEEAV